MGIYQENVKINTGFGRIAKEEGIEIVGTHDDFDLMLEDFDQALENHRLLGTTNMGNLSWDLILETAERCGVKYYVVEQDTNYEVNCFASIKTSAEYLKTFLK